MMKISQGFRIFWKYWRPRGNRGGPCFHRLRRDFLWRLWWFLQGCWTLGKVCLFLCFLPCNSAWCRILRGCDRALFSFARLVVGLLKDGFAFYGVLLAGLFRIDMSLLFALFFRKVLLLVLLFLRIFRTGILILWIAWSLIGWWKGLGSVSRCLFIFLFLLCLFYYQLLIMASLTWKCNFFISQVEARFFFHCLN